MSSNEQLERLLRFNEKINAKLGISQINSTNQQALSRLVGVLIIL
jgi:hypothetical protein